MSQAAASYESSLLLTLEEISTLVAHSHDPHETLTNIVRLIQGRFHTAVCSVYVLDAVRGELVLGATVGLKSDSVGRIRMRLDEGLTGLVAERREPIMVADAFRHPRFKYFPEAGEDPYHSFLGVPLVEGGAFQGVLVVQTMEPRTFSPSEVRMLVTVAAQVASLVGDARLLELATAATHEPPGAAGPAATTQRATPLSPGVGVGEAYVVDGFADWRKTAPVRGADPAAEHKRLVEAMDEARDEIVRISQRLSELVGEDHGAILHAQLMILQDRAIENDLAERLREGASAETALLDVLDKYVAAFQKLASPFFQERIYDIKDVFYRILWRLRPRAATAAAGRLVLVAREASVMELFAADLDRLAGVVFEHGGPQSHAAILARSLGVPMVGQPSDFAALRRPGRRLRVDGTAGVVDLDPPEDDATQLRPGGRVVAPSAVAASAPGLPRVEVNINLLYEVGPAMAQGVAGVGLFRSEFLFLARRTLPTEEEQVGIYRKLLGRLGGRPATIRTFDLRPDKLAAYVPFGSSARPLDWRRVLDSPPLRRLFLEQVRAVLRAATEGTARILVPLVTSGELLDFVVETAAAAKESLARDGLAFAADVPVGAMIETAAAVPLVADWADRVAFFALGTNDLAASALGVDRDDPDSGRADPLHPGLLRLLGTVVDAARAAGRPVSVCGEAAADPLGAAALAILGVESLSVPVNQWAATRRAVAGWTAATLAEARPRLLRCRTAEEVRGLLTGQGDSRS
jgi:phosphotransferase system enzyme I (PtsP)